MRHSEYYVILPNDWLRESAALGPYRTEQEARDRAAGAKRAVVVVRIFEEDDR